MTALFVVCLILGLLFSIASIFDWESIYALWDVEATRLILGEGAARLFCGGVGIAIVCISAVVLLR